MFWGILIGIVLTVLSAAGALVLLKKEVTPLTYIVIVFALVAFCVEGVMLTNAISARNNADDMAASLQETAFNYLDSDQLDYQISLPEATGIQIALRLVFPKVARFIEPSDLAGHSVAECTEIMRKAIVSNASRQIWMSVLYIVITMAVASALMMLVAGIGGGGSKRGGRGGRAGMVRKAEMPGLRSLCGDAPGKGRLFPGLRNPVGGLDPGGLPGFLPGN